MSEFYDISPEKSLNENSFALKDLGEKRSTITYGFKTKTASRRGRSQSYSRPITDDDYDKEFIDKMFKLKRPYEVDKLLDYHYDYYITKEPEQRNTFLKHIQYVILRDVDKRDSKSSLIELTKEWLDAKKATIKASSKQDDNLSTKKSRDDNEQTSISNAVLEDGEVFMSYSWDTAEHQDKVLSFTDHLRIKGYNAQLDKMLTQGESAPNFIKMMHKAMLQHKKVIVVLSEGYKNKAESFIGGVGEEYELLLNDIKKSHKKYILVSFVGRSEAITPFGLIGREIIDLSQLGGEDRLFRKLSDQDEYVFSPVGAEKPTLPPIPIAPYRPLIQSVAIKILPPLVKMGDMGSSGNLYRYIEYELTFKFQNTSSSIVDGLAYDVSIKQELAPEYYGQPEKDGYFDFKRDLSKKIYPNQVVDSDIIKLKAANYSKYQFVDTLISLNVYTDSGTITENYNVNDLLAVPPANEGYKAPMPLTIDIFI